MGNRFYVAIDLKSFYASVECVERGLDPLDTMLVVADESRTDKTICLAVSPALKALGTGGRPRLFEVKQRVREVNRGRQPSGVSSRSAAELARNASMRVDFIIARPRMAFYIEYSTRIYSIYLRHIAPADIHVYSIDEVFIDVTPYLKSTGMTPHEMAMTMIREVLRETGITATAGIGTNMYLAKVAMDIEAKRMPPDEDGVRIAELDEMSYRRRLWSHRPLTDFWRVGRGIARRLLPYGIVTMGDIARMSLSHEELLYDVLGINAELLIDHAWGREPVTIAQVKAYRPATTSISSGQVLTGPYDAHKTLVVVKEMVEAMALDLLDRHMLTPRLTLTIGYDVENLKSRDISSRYDGPVVTDHYGRAVPKAAHGVVTLDEPTCSAKMMTTAVEELYRRIINSALLSRRITLTAENLIDEFTAEAKVRNRPAAQLDLFTDYEALRRQ